MEEGRINVSFVGMEATDALKSYVIEKISKQKELIKMATSLNVTLIEKVRHRGVHRDFKVDVNVALPKTVIRVEEVGDDMYALIDKASDILVRRFRRYLDKIRQWEGHAPWETEECKDLFVDEEVDDDYVYTNWKPKVAVRKRIGDERPMEEAEAIEMMELRGFNQMLFKNKTTGKYTMVYKRERGGYGLVEPGDGV